MSSSEGSNDGPIVDVEDDLILGVEDNNGDRVINVDVQYRNDPSSPFYFRETDRPNKPIVTTILRNGQYYNAWRFGMEIGLECRNKLVFVEGQLPCPIRSDPRYHSWQVSDKIIRRWIVGSCTEEIAGSIKNLGSSAEMWQALKTQFDQVSEEYENSGTSVWFPGSDGADAILRGDRYLSHVCGQPSYIKNAFDLHSLRPLALKKLIEALKLKDRSVFEDIDKFVDFRWFWEILYHSRWPEHHLDGVVDVESFYWESHLQQCIDVCVVALDDLSQPVSLSDMMVPDTILDYIGRHMAECKTLASHCEAFAPYLRTLRLPPQLLLEDDCLKHLRLQDQFTKLVFVSLDTIEDNKCLLNDRGKAQVEAVLEVVKQNKDCLKEMEIIESKLCDGFLGRVYYESLSLNLGNHKLEKLVIKDSALERFAQDELPIGLEAMIKFGSSLGCVTLSGLSFLTDDAVMIFKTMCQNSSCISKLDLSHNRLGGLFKKYQSMVDESPEEYGPLVSLLDLNLRSCLLNDEDISHIKFGYRLLPPSVKIDYDDKVPIVERFKVIEEK